MRIVLVAFCSASISWSEPKVLNPSFEADKYGKSPGHARVNGGKITGWKYTGGVGINPWWNDPARQTGPTHSFSDNGRVPHGRQVALMQNKCTLSQTIYGFEAGKEYRVTYRENARHNRAPERRPKLKVTLGGQTIVSLHEIAPVDGFGMRSVPYNLVESAVFTAPERGGFDLVFTTTVHNRVTALIDDVKVKEVGAGVRRR